MNKIEAIIDNIIAVEGGFTNNPADKGGATCWGITESTARQSGYKGDMKDLPKDFAKQIYLARYFLQPHFDRVFDVSQDIAAELMDTGVNCGVGFAAPLIQDCLNLLNRNKDYPDLLVDGNIGDKTISCLKTYLNKRGKDGEQVILKMLNIMQGQRYIDICRKNPTQKEFLYGWINNRVGV